MIKSAEKYFSNMKFGLLLFRTLNPLLMKIVNIFNKKMVYSFLEA